MADIIQLPEKYDDWIVSVSERYRICQIRAAVKVNEEMLRFYFVLGMEMDKLKKSFKWGDNFYKTVSQDLEKLLPGIKSFSPKNLSYMHRFYSLFSSLSICPQLVGKLDSASVDECECSSSFESSVLTEDAFHCIFQIPWGHYRYIIDKCKGNSEKALFYVQKTLENNWSRAVLLNFLDTNLYERQGKAVSNFAQTLPKPQSDLAQEITRDPYSFDFLTIRERYDEKELKDALMDNITKFLLELGNGFSFVGREFRIDMGGTENFIDMLFYNIRLHCYVVIEVKVTEFETAFTGQLGAYVVAVNHQLKGEGDAQTIGLLVCKSKDNVKASYALEASSQPLGVSAYELSSLIPEEYRGSMPTIEEIEQELGK